jgi:hypothetical protein
MIVVANNPAILVILRREYLEITENFCAAKLIEYFQHWTKWKLENQRTPWIYQPLKRIYADLMGEHSLHVVRRAIALLESLGILQRRKNPGNGQDKTWQYKLNLDVLNKLLEHGKLRNESSRFNGEQYHNNNPLTSDPQQHVAVVEEFMEPDWDYLAKEIASWEQSEILHLFDESESVNSPDEQIPHDDLFSPVMLDIASNNFTNEQVPDDDQPTAIGRSAGIDEQGRSPFPQAISATPNEERQNICTTSMVNLPLKQPEVDFSDFTTQQLQEVCNELKRLQINPESCLGVIKQYWDNVLGALARVKQGIQDGWCRNPTGLFINSCKHGIKFEKFVGADVHAWFDWARRERIAIAMTGGLVYTPDGEAFPLAEMMQQHPLK